MNADRLLEHYEKIADAPDAIARLRRFVLDLAVRGKLVRQDANDEPASELLERIKQERIRREKLKAIKCVKLQYGPIALDTDFDLPSKWEKTTLGETCDLQTGATPDRNQPEFFGGDIPWLVSGDINRGEIFDCDGRITTAGLGSSNCKILPENCVLIALNGQGKTRATVALLRMQAACNQSLVAIIPLLGSDLTAEYVHLSLKARYVAIRELTGSDERRGLNMRLLECFEIAIPPIAEQHRIVAKVDELMGLCDRLEAARAGREATRDRLAAASLARLNAPDPETFQADARFALDALPALTTRPDQIKALRQTILNLAVRGKLVPQDPKDEPAINFDRAIPDDLERPFEIPRTWHWARLRTLGKLKGGGTPSKVREDFWNGNIPWVSPKDMKMDYIAEAQMSITDAALMGSAANLIESGSVLFVVRGMILAHSFPVAMALAPLTINQDMKALVLKKPEMGEYVLRALKGIKPEMLKRVQRSSHGTCRLEGSDYSDFPIPIPPLTEQHRIVAKVDALMALCDRVEASLITTAATRRRLLDAFLSDALVPKIARPAPPLEIVPGMQSSSVSPSKLDFTERTAIVLAFAYERHRRASRDKTFGHVKAQKILHMVEAETELDLGRAPVKDAAGPNDFPHMLAADEWAHENQHFSFEKIDSGYRFRRLEKFEQLMQAARQIEPSTRTRIEQIIDLFIPMDMKQAEIFATVYAAWNNLLIEGKTPMDDEIVRAAREEWHPSKNELARERFHKALRHLKSTDFIPRGRGRLVGEVKQTSFQF